KTRLCYRFRFFLNYQFRKTKIDEKIHQILHRFRNDSSIMIASQLLDKIIFRQLFDRISCTYTYLLACKSSKNAVLIDPVREEIERDLNLIKQLNLKLKYVLNTHVHADHVSGSGGIKQISPNIKSIISTESKAQADIKVTDGDVIKISDQIHLNVISTPGHTKGCVSYCLDNQMVFTGDALLIRGCGRTDFQEGDSGQLYDSIHGKLFRLPGECLVLPGHDYNGNTCSTIEEEKNHNPRLLNSREEFVELMKNLRLPFPQMIESYSAQF
ncbi:Persulfide dioxygenase ETHE1, partial [Sarcoptes scabiei]